MKIELKDFQTTALAELYAEALSARDEVERRDRNQGLVLASPTGSGKTIIATAWMEQLLRGNENEPPDPKAVFLWITDQPELNVQTRRKIIGTSSVYGRDDVVVIEREFDKPRFDPGCVYFLNIQKVGRERYLVGHGDNRKHTIWETITRTASEQPGSFWVVLDEAHKGMRGTADDAVDDDGDEEIATTIVQKFLHGSPGEIPAIRLILGISATPERFTQRLNETQRVQRPCRVSPSDVRASGLLKDTVTLHHPVANTPGDVSMLAAAAHKLEQYTADWAAYSAEQEAPVVEPLLVVQVEDATAEDRITDTDLGEAIEVLEKSIGALSDQQIAHSLQDHYTVLAGGRSIRYIAPPDIQDDPALRVVFFKQSLNVGWDCPRAEVIVSFRTHRDQTLIAQLIGRMVRTPLSRRVTTSDFLNSVCLYLPFFDSRRVGEVVKYLTNPDPDVAFPVEVEEGATLEQWSRRRGTEEIFERAATIPSYSLERVAKLSNARRLIRLGRALAYDKIEAKAAAAFKDELVRTLLSERTRLARKRAFKEHLAASGKIDIRVVDVAYGSDAAPVMAHESLRLLTQNIDDLFAQSGRRFGEGLHLAYVKARVNGASAPTPTQAKLEAVALAHEQPTYDRVEKAAGEHFDKTVRKHQAAIRKLPDERQAVYRRLRRQAVKPAAEELVLRQSIQARREGTAWGLHLYADKDGQFTCALNSWETQLLEEELARKGVVGWLRNIPRKDWSLTIPYDHRGETRPFYPDFLIFRREHDDIVVDIMEPHSLAFEDAADKAVGLATFASLHGDAFSKIELIIKEQQKLARLDVNDPDVRKRVLAVEGNQHLRDIVLAL